MAGSKKNIFVIGLEDFNRRLLQKVRGAENYTFHGLTRFESVAQDPHSDVQTLLTEAFRTLDSFPGTIDAIVGYWDFPGVLIMPILRAHYGLPGPSLESVLRCEHKYWARLIQKRALPEVVPPFALVDPFAAKVLDRRPLPYPFWLKPVKAHSSILGFRVRNHRDFRNAIKRTRSGIHMLAQKLNDIMAYADLSPEIMGVDGWKCVAEGIISRGRQCTLEGYVFDGEAQIYGIVDSIRGPNHISFQRYQYPSSLPKAVQQRMVDAAKILIGRAGLDNSPFNMEFFWNRHNDRIWMLETNARISKSHSPLFDKVHGTPHKEVMIDVALGRKPDYPRGRGPFRHAAKFMLRHYRAGPDDVVTAAPDSVQLRAIEQRFPGCEVSLHVKPGMRLKDLRFQDSYSYALADIFVGANSRAALTETCYAVVDSLGIEIGGQRDHQTARNHRHATGTALH